MMDAWEGEILLWKFWVLEIAFEEVNRNHEKSQYGVATISRLLEIIGLFCKRALYKRRFSAEETYYSKVSTNCPPHRKDVAESREK